MKLEVKICGIRDNAHQVAGLKPDYMGFIFHGPSPRNLPDDYPCDTWEHISKVGVFVDSPFEFIETAMARYKLDVVQLHGSESPEFCSRLSSTIPVWKMFPVADNLDFDSLKTYSGVVDRFLFDTKGVSRGGNGTRFDWSLLYDYPLDTPFVLSGGIGPGAEPEIRDLASRTDKLVTIDLNSRFELRPGLKEIESLKHFMHELSR